MSRYAVVAIRREDPEWGGTYVESTGSRGSVEIGTLGGFRREECLSGVDTGCRWLLIPAPKRRDPVRTRS